MVTELSMSMRGRKLRIRKFGTGNLDPEGREAGRASRQKAKSQCSWLALGSGNLLGLVKLNALQ